MCKILGAGPVFKKANNKGKEKVEGIHARERRLQEEADRRAPMKTPIGDLLATRPE